MNSKNAFFTLFLVIFVSIIAQVELHLKFQREQAFRKVLTTEYEIRVIHKDGTSTILDPEKVDQIILEKR